MDRDLVVKQVVKEFLSIYPDVYLPPIRFNSRLTRTAGRVKYRRGVFKAFIIELSTNLLDTHEKLTQTLRHELAHVLDISIRGYSNHDESWQRIMMSLGAEPKQYHNYNSVACGAKPNAKCSCSGHRLSIIKANKVKRGKANYRCKKCKERLKLC